MKWLNDTTDRIDSQKPLHRVVRQGLNSTPHSKLSTSSRYSAGNTWTGPLGSGGETGSKALISHDRLTITPTATKVVLGDSYSTEYSNSCHSPYPRGARGLSRLIDMDYQAWARHRPSSPSLPTGQVRPMQAPPRDATQRWTNSCQQNCLECSGRHLQKGLTRLGVFAIWSPRLISLPA